MADFSSFTTKFRAQKIGSQESQSSKVVKRARLVCNQCHRSKLRCDLNHPCNSCIKKNDAASCTYQRPVGSKIDANRSMMAEERLSHLESMISQLMEKQGPRQSGRGEILEALNVPNDASQIPLDMAPALGTEQSESYAGGTHWSAMLDDIQDLKTILGSSNLHEARGPVTSQQLDGAPGSELIFGSSTNYSLQEILSSYLPSKVEFDRLLATYFQGEVYMVPFIHTYHFQNQYQEFWKNPETVHPLWLSTLFSICFMASKIGESMGYHQNSHSHIYLHTAAGRCLVLGEYHRPQKLALEALALYAHCKTFKSLDLSREAGAILAIVVRMALELGYHRDPDYFGTFSVFDGEIRRRLWAALKQMELMLSFQLGLPSSIYAENCDTKSPKNLLDSDFNADTKVLPPSRPDEEATKLSWFIVKERQMTVFSKVCRHALSFAEKSEAEIMQLDQEIRDMFTTIPNNLRTRPICESIVDPPFLIMTRLYVDFIHLKSLCVLHRKYMVHGNVTSTKACVHAGSRLVSQFLDMYKEFSPGGQLFGGRWMLNSFNMNDFLLGLMVLCSVLHTQWKFDSENSTIDTDTETEILSLLEQAHVICVEKSAASKDAQKVSQAVFMTLNRSKTNHQNAIVETLDGSDFLLPPWHSYIQAGDNPFNFMSNDSEILDWTVFDGSVDLAL